MRPEPGPPCIIGRCRHPGVLFIGHEGYLCESHADKVWYKIEWRDADRSSEEIVGREGRDYTRVEARAKRTVERRKPSSMGEIYFVQVDELIKVGWTTKLADRVRAYGPNAVLLANYPGSRADEAALHRQLTPARYRGREWYSDGDIIRMFISEAIEKHGPPRFQTIGWSEPRQVVAGKRATRGRR